jgi:hypothetical protein
MLRLGEASPTCGVAAALHETMRIMEEIDALIDEHGGWPIE